MKVDHSLESESVQVGDGLSDPPMERPAPDLFWFARECHCLIVRRDLATGTDLGQIWIHRPAMISVSYPIDLPQIFGHTSEAAAVAWAVKRALNLLCKRRREEDRQQRRRNRHALAWATGTQDGFGL